MSLSPLTTDVVPAVAGGGALALAVTASDLTTLTVAITALIAAVGAVVVNILSARAAARASDRAAIKIQEVSVKADVITGHVNSAASAAAAKIDAMAAEIQTLTVTVADQRKIADLLAQQAAMVAALAAVARPPRATDAPAPGLPALAVLPVPVEGVNVLPVKVKETP